MNSMDLPQPFKPPGKSERSARQRWTNLTLGGSSVPESTGRVAPPARQCPDRRAEGEAHARGRVPHYGAEYGWRAERNRARYELLATTDLVNPLLLGGRDRNGRAIRLSAPAHGGITGR